MEKNQDVFVFDSSIAKEWTWGKTYYSIFEKDLSIDALKRQIIEQDRQVATIETEFNNLVKSQEFRSALDEQSWSQFYSQSTKLRN